MKSKTEKPPCICDFCYENPIRSKFDTSGEEYYCPHYQGGAVVIKTGPAWLVRPGVTPGEYRERSLIAEALWAAKRLLANGDSSSN